MVLRLVPQVGACVIFFTKLSLMRFVDRKNISKEKRKIRTVYSLLKKYLRSKKLHFNNKLHRFVFL